MRTKTEQNQKPLIRVIAAAVVFVFTATSAVWPAPIQVATNVAGAGIAVSIPTAIEIPEEIGMIQTQQIDPNAERVIILVQDAHAIIDAQQNIRKLLAFFQESYGSEIFYVEGAAGKLDPTLFRTFPDTKIKKRVIAGYLNAAEFSGADTAAALNKYEGDFYGLEDWGLYSANYFAFQRAQAEKQGLQARLKAIETELRVQGEKVFSVKLKEFQETITNFRAERISLLDLLLYLANFSSLMKGKPEFAELAKLTDTLGYENSGKQKALEPIVKKMAEEFKKRFVRDMDTRDQSNFYMSFQNFMTGRISAGQMLKYLVQAGSKLGFRPKLTPQMRRLLGHTEVLTEIKGSRLYEELEKFLPTAQESLVRNADERVLVEKYQKLFILEDLVKLELTHEELAAYQKDPDGCLALLGSEDTRKEIAPALEFYDYALRRDREFYERVRKASPTAKTVVLIAGGFHTNGVERILQEKGESYAVLTPRIESLTGKDNYFKAMAGDLAYMEYLTTTYYDAMMRYSVRKLTESLSESEFKRIAKLWRDNLIRDLADKHRITDLKEYTRYLDELNSVYQERFGGEQNTRSRAEILDFVQKRLEKFRDESLAAVWKNFEEQLNVFTTGLQGLIDKKQLDAEHVTGLLNDVNRAKPVMLNFVDPMTQESELKLPVLAPSFEITEKVPAVKPETGARAEVRTEEGEHPWGAEDAGLARQLELLRKNRNLEDLRNLSSSLGDADKISRTNQLYGKRLVGTPDSADSPFGRFLRKWKAIWSGKNYNVEVFRGVGGDEFALIDPQNKLNSDSLNESREELNDDSKGVYAFFRINRDLTSDEKGVLRDMEIEGKKPVQIYDKHGTGTNIRISREGLSEKGYIELFLKIHKSFNLGASEFGAFEYETPERPPLTLSDGTVRGDVAIEILVKEMGEAYWFEKADDGKTLILRENRLAEFQYWWNVLANDALSYAKETGRDRAVVMDLENYEEMITKKITKDKIEEVSERFKDPEQAKSARQIDTLSQFFIPKVAHAKVNELIKSWKQKRMMVFLVSNYMTDKDGNPVVDRAFHAAQALVGYALGNAIIKKNVDISKSLLGIGNESAEEMLKKKVVAYREVDEVVKVMGEEAAVRGPPTPAMLDEKGLEMQKTLQGFLGEKAKASPKLIVIDIDGADLERLKKSGNKVAAHFADLFEAKEITVVASRFAEFMKSILPWVEDLKAAMDVEESPEGNLILRFNPDKAEKLYELYLQGVDQQMLEAMDELKVRFVTVEEMKERLAQLESETAVQDKEPTIDQVARKIVRETYNYIAVSGAHRLLLPDDVPEAEAEADFQEGFISILAGEIKMALQAGVFPADVSGLPLMKAILRSIHSMNPNSKLQKSDVLEQINEGRKVVDVLREDIEAFVKREIEAKRVLYKEIAKKISGDTELNWFSGKDSVLELRKTAYEPALFSKDLEYAVYRGMGESGLSEEETRKVIIEKLNQKRSLLENQPGEAKGILEKINFSSAAKGRAEVRDDLEFVEPAPGGASAIVKILERNPEVFKGMADGTLARSNTGAMIASRSKNMEGFKGALIDQLSFWVPESDGGKDNEFFALGERDIDFKLRPEMAWSIASKVAGLISRGFEPGDLAASLAVLMVALENGETLPKDGYESIVSALYEGLDSFKSVRTAINKKSKEDKEKEEKKLKEALKETLMSFGRRDFTEFIDALNSKLKSLQIRKKQLNPGIAFSFAAALCRVEQGKAEDENFKAEGEDIESIKREFYRFLGFDPKTPPKETEALVAELEKSLVQRDFQAVHFFDALNLLQVAAKPSNFEASGMIKAVEAIYRYDTNQALTPTQVDSIVKVLYVKTAIDPKMEWFRSKAASEEYTKIVESLAAELKSPEKLLLIRNNYSTLHELEFAFGEALNSLHVFLSEESSASQLVDSATWLLEETKLTDFRIRRTVVELIGSELSKFNEMSETSQKKQSLLYDQMLFSPFAKRVAEAYEYIVDQWDSNEVDIKDPVAQMRFIFAESLGKVKKTMNEGKLGSGDTAGVFCATMYEVAEVPLPTGRRQEIRGEEAVIPVTSVTSVPAARSEIKAEAGEMESGKSPSVGARENIGEELSQKFHFGGNVGALRLWVSQVSEMSGKSSAEIMAEMLNDVKTSKGTVTRFGELPEERWIYLLSMAKAVSETGGMPLFLERGMHPYAALWPQLRQRLIDLGISIPADSMATKLVDNTQGIGRDFSPDKRLSIMSSAFLTLLTPEDRDRIISENEKESLREIWKKIVQLDQEIVETYLGAWGIGSFEELLGKERLTVGLFVKYLADAGIAPEHTRMQFQAWKMHEILSRAYDQATVQREGLPTYSRIREQLLHSNETFSPQLRFSDQEMREVDDIFESAGLAKGPILRDADNFDNSNLWVSFFQAFKERRKSNELIRSPRYIVGPILSEALKDVPSLRKFKKYPLVIMDDASGMGATLLVSRLVARIISLNEPKMGLFYVDKTADGEPSYIDFAGNVGEIKPFEDRSELYDALYKTGEGADGFPQVIRTTYDDLKTAWLRSVEEIPDTQGLYEQYLTGIQQLISTYGDELFKDLPDLVHARKSKEFNFREEIIKAYFRGETDPTYQLILLDFFASYTGELDRINWDYRSMIRKDMEAVFNRLKAMEESGSETIKKELLKIRNLESQIGPLNKANSVEKLQKLYQKEIGRQNSGLSLLNNPGIAEAVKLYFKGEKTFDALKRDIMFAADFNLLEPLPVRAELQTEVPVMEAPAVASAGQQRAEVRWQAFRGEAPPLESTRAETRSMEKLFTSRGEEIGQKPFIRSSVDAGAKTSGIVFFYDPTKDILLKEMITRLKGDAALVIFVQDGVIKEDLKRWIEANKKEQRIVLFNANAKLSTWARDRLSVVETDTGWKIVVPWLSPQESLFRRNPNETLRKFAESVGMEIMESPLAFAGGNILSNGKTIFVSKNLIEENLKRFGGDVEAIKQELLKIFGNSGDIYVLDDPYNYHIDMCLTLLPGNVVLLGDPSLGMAALDSDSEENRQRFYDRVRYWRSVYGYAFGNVSMEITRQLTEKYQQRVDRLAESLEREGFNVQRIPIILGDEHGGGVKPIATYNNVIFDENDVLLPQYGIAADAAAGREYGNRGYEVKPLNAAFVSMVEEGCARCLSQKISSFSPVAQKAWDEQVDQMQQRIAAMPEPIPDQAASSARAADWISELRKLRGLSFLPFGKARFVERFDALIDESLGADLEVFHAFWDSLSNAKNSRLVDDYLNFGANVGSKLKYFVLILQAYPNLANYLGKMAEDRMTSDAMKNFIGLVMTAAREIQTEGLPVRAELQTEVPVMEAPAVAPAGQQRAEIRDPLASFLELLTTNGFQIKDQIGDLKGPADVYIKDLGKGRFEIGVKSKDRGTLKGIASVDGMEEKNFQNAHPNFLGPFHKTRRMIQAIFEKPESLFSLEFFKKTMGWSIIGTYFQLMQMPPTLINYGFDRIYYEIRLRLGLFHRRANRWLTNYILLLQGLEQVRERMLTPLTKTERDNLREGYRILSPDNGPVEGGRLIQGADGRQYLLVEKPTVWEFRSTPFGQVNDAFSKVFNDSTFLEEIEKRAREKAQRGETLTYVSWGAGDMNEIVDLSRQLKEKGIKNVRLIAYSDAFFDAWGFETEGIEIIFDTWKNFPNYFQPGSIDILGSHIALSHLKDIGVGQEGASFSENSYFRYLTQSLKPLLSTDGIVIDVLKGELTEAERSAFQNDFDLVFHQGPGTDMIIAMAGLMFGQPSSDDLNVALYRNKSATPTLPPAGDHSEVLSEQQKGAEGIVEQQQLPVRSETRVNIGGLGEIDADEVVRGGMGSVSTIQKRAEVTFAVLKEKTAEEIAGLIDNTLRQKKDLAGFLISKEFRDSFEGEMPVLVSISGPQMIDGVIKDITTFVLIPAEMPLTPTQVVDAVSLENMKEVEDLIRVLEAAADDRKGPKITEITYHPGASNVEEMLRNLRLVPLDRLVVLYSPKEGQVVGREWQDLVGATITRLAVDPDSSIKNPKAMAQKAIERTEMFGEVPVAFWTKDLSLGDLGIFSMLAEIGKLSSPELKQLVFATSRLAFAIYASASKEQQSKYMENPALLLNEINKIAYPNLDKTIPGLKAEKGMLVFVMRDLVQGFVAREEIRTSA